MNGATHREGAGAVERDVYRRSDRLLAGVEFELRRVDEDVVGNFIVIDDMDHGTARDPNGVRRESAVVLTDRYGIAGKNHRRRQGGDERQGAIGSSAPSSLQKRIANPARPHHGKTRRGARTFNIDFKSAPALATLRSPDGIPLGGKSEVTLRGPIGLLVRSSGMPGPRTRCRR